MDHGNSVITPGLGHGPYLCVGIAGEVILKDSVTTSCVIAITTYRIEVLNYQEFIYATMNFIFALKNKISRGLKT